MEYMQGGAVSRARRCGICCRIEVQGEANGVCVGAEFAAKLIIDNGFNLPDGWPDEDYSGREYLTNYSETR